MLDHKLTHSSVTPCFVPSNLDSSSLMSSASTSIESTIEGLDLILLMSGCKLYTCSRLLRFINLAARFQCIALLYWVILIKVAYISSDPDPIFTFNISIIHLFQLINHHYLLTRIGKVRQLHKLMVSAINGNKRVYLRRLTFVMAFIWVIASLFSIITYQLCILDSDERILIIYNFYAIKPYADEVTGLIKLVTRYLMLFFFATRGN